jgi:methionine-rich copper-binding protein CopC
MFKLVILTSYILIFFLAKPVQCHVFPESSSPAVGSTVKKAPAEIKIWFDGKLEPVFCKIKVTTEDGIEVDKKDSHVDKSNPVLLDVGLKELKPGNYHVYWSAVARDGHHTQGDYSFTYKKG